MQEQPQVVTLTEFKELERLLEVVDTYKKEEDMNEGEERRGDGREREKWREMPSEGTQLQSVVVIVGGAVGGEHWVGECA